MAEHRASGGLSRRSFMAYSAAGLGVGALTSIGAIKFLAPVRNPARTQTLDFSIHPALLVGVPEIAHSFRLLQKTVIEKSAGELIVRLCNRGGDAEISSPILDFASRSEPAIPLFGGQPTDPSPEWKHEWLSSRAAEAMWDRVYRGENKKIMLFAVGSSASGLLVRSGTRPDLLDPNVVFTASRYFLRKTYRKMGLNTKDVSFRDWFRIINDPSLTVLDPIRPQLAVNFGLTGGSHFAYITGDWLGPQVFHLKFQANTWNRLGDEYQRVLREATSLVSEVHLRKSIQASASAEQYLVRLTAAEFGADLWSKDFKSKFSESLKEHLISDHVGSEVWRLYSQQVG